MWNLLIVDDENLIVEDIKASIDWNKLGISNVFTSFSMRQAKEVYENNRIDIMLCDIEMPQGSGLELLSWVREFYPKTESIFLTCHADFSYAKEAVRLGSMDYILKPIPYEELEAAIAKGINKVKKDSKLEEFSRFGEFWFKHQPLLIERFWLDIIYRTISSTPEDIKNAADYRNIPYSSEVRVLPVLISVQRWHKKMSFSNEKNMEFGLKNIAEEILAKEGQRGQFFELKNGGLIGILSPENGADSSISTLEERSEKYITSCNQYLSCDLCCYIGEVVYAYELAAAVEELMLKEKNNVTFYNKVFTAKDKTRSSVSINTINKAKKYIRLHLDQELTREEIANHVYINPDYLGRIFKKETGESVAKFIMQERLNVAKELLTNTDMPISTIAANVGYTNLSNFSIMFKKMIGINPADYRKNALKEKSE